MYTIAIANLIPTTLLQKSEIFGRPKNFGRADGIFDPHPVLKNCKYLRRIAKLFFGELNVLWDMDLKRNEMRYPLLISRTEGNF